MNNTNQEYEAYQEAIKTITQYIITTTGMESPEHIQSSLEDAIEEIKKDLIDFKDSFVVEVKKLNKTCDDNDGFNQKYDIPNFDKKIHNIKTDKFGKVTAKINLTEEDIEKVMGQKIKKVSLGAKLL